MGIWSTFPNKWPLSQISALLKQGKEISSEILNTREASDNLGGVGINKFENEDIIEKRCLEIQF